MLGKLINEVLNENNNFEEFIKNEIKVNIEKSIKKVLEELICYRYSKFSENLSKKLEEQLSVNLDRIDIAQYNQFFKEKINDSITQIVNDETREKIKKAVDGILYKELNLSELLEDFKREIAQWDDDIQEIYLCIENDDLFKTVYLDKEKPKYGNYECKYRLMFLYENLTGVSIKDEDKEDVILSNNSFNGLLKNIYLQGKIIKLDLGDDANNYDTEINREDYDD